MARFERLDPRADDLPAYDGNIDDGDEEEGSRLPLLIFIAVLVLFLFAGVVYYAYTEGVERGRADAPRVMVAQSTGTKLKVYQQPAPADDQSAEADSVPPPPTPAPTTPPASTSASSPADAGQPGDTAQTETIDNAPPAASSPVVKVTPKPVEKVATASPPPPKPAVAVSTSALPRVATHAPAPLVAPAEPPATTAPPPAAVATTTPAVTEPAPKPATGGSTLLQIGAYKSQDEADSAWHAFQKKHPVVGGYQSDIKQVDLAEKGTWYRLRIGPFETKEAATDLCAKLKADGASCLIAR